MTEENGLWIFGYGSLCWNPGFAFKRSMTGYVKGFCRRFWQGNTTHRGTERKPGRVVTLIEDKDEITHGRVFEIKGETALPYLKMRECTLGGYITKFTTFYSRDGKSTFPVLIYIATKNNEHWMGEAPLHAIAKQILECEGPSGHNAEYLLRLAYFMHRFVPEAIDEHLFTLETLVRAYIKKFNLCIHKLMGNRVYAIELLEIDAKFENEPSDEEDNNIQGNGPLEHTFEYTSRVPTKMLRCLKPVEDEDVNAIEVAETFNTSRKKPCNTHQLASSLFNRSYEPRVFVPMETVLDELLKKLKVEHVVWCKDKGSMYYEVIFPVPAGDPCENCLHCLTAMGIGTRMNSIVSVIPTQCTYSALQNSTPNTIAHYSVFNKVDVEDRTNGWEAFINSIRSKLTVKQVVDGVRSGGDLTFDYIVLVLTADCLAALGLVENSAINVVAAMLVSPLMGPVMSLTFGIIIMDRDLICTGLKSLSLGIFLSILFGFIFGLILGTTEMPWGYNDWPTDEMKGRGNYRSLWMGILWALPSGTGVAVALLQGSNGPLIGVAISASLLPPVVNCGLYWALGCIWLIYRPIKMPHMKGELYTDFNTSYVYVYSEHLPVEFFCNGIISACLTLINVMCIFITAIMVLKLKEVAAPYTSTPELRRFWQHDIPHVRDKNISRDNSSIDSSYYESLSKGRQQALERTLDEAVKEAINDETYRKVKRVSYGPQAPDEIPPRFGIFGNINDSDAGHNNKARSNTKDGFSTVTPHSPDAFSSGENNNEDLVALDKLITYLLGQSSGNADNWRRSRRTSARGYHQLQPDAINTGANARATSDISTTPL